MLKIADQARAIGHDVTVFHGKDPALFEREHEHLIYVFPEQFDDAHRAKTAHLYHYNLNLYNKTLLRIPIQMSFFFRRIFAVNRAYWIRKAVRDPHAKILVNCTDSTVWLKKHFGIYATPILGAVDHNLFHASSVSKDQNVIKILCLGSPKYWKGTADIERAVAIVRKTYPNVVLEKFYGTPQEKLPQMYSKADIFVDAQIYAGWNNPVAEAMACKVPVVCYDIGPNRDIAEHEKTALLVPPKRPEMMAQAIVRLLEDQALRERLINQACAVIQRFTWEKTTRDFLTALYAKS